MAVDPSRGSVVMAAPQTWNRYVYAANNPLKYVDPNGEDLILAPGLSRSDAKYVTKAALNLLATPTGGALMRRLDAKDRKIFITTGRFAPVTTVWDSAGKHATKQGKAGDTRIDPSTGDIYIVIDKKNQKALQAAGGDDPAQTAFLCRR